MSKKAWHPDVKVPGTPLITKVKLSVDNTGTLQTCKVINTSQSAQYDQSVSDFCKAFSFAPLPPKLQTIDLFWTFMADDSMSMVEFTDSPEANQYYTALLGGVITPRGTLVLKAQRRAGFGWIPDVTNQKGPHSLAAQKDIDFGPYMADLQRKIKLSWVKPKGNESKRIVVQFKIHRDGTLSNLMIDHSSGVAVADQAALKAVENAAPFKQLPDGAPNDVDIQFTFDNNVFGGGGHGTFRSF